MKIALYQPWIYLHGGLEKSLLEVVRRSAHQWVVYTGHYEPQNTFAEFANVDVRLLNPTTINRSIGGTLYSAFQVLRQKLPLDDDVDAVVVWCDGIGDLIVFRNRDLPIFNICSTPLRAAFDPVYQELALTGKNRFHRFAYRVFKHSFRYVDRKAWRFYDGIVTTSREVRNRIVDGLLCIDDEKMTMAYPGIELQTDHTGNAYEPFILLPGRIMWTKNIQQGIRGFVDAQLPKPWKLVVAGYVDKKSQRYLEKLRAMVPAGVAVEFVVSPTNEALEELYRKASFCLFTPLNEDWGIVPLEAMNFCKPVVAHASGGPLESIVHDETGILIAPYDAEGWTIAIRKLALDPALCMRMGLDANRAVQKYAWRHFVHTIDEGIRLWVEAKRATAALAVPALP